MVAALPAEARCALAGQRHAGVRNLLVRASGIGGVPATQAAETLLAAGAEALLCFGVAGALDPALRCGDIVLATEVLTLSKEQASSSRAAVGPMRIATDLPWRQALVERLSGLGRVRLGALLASDEVVASAQRKQHLFQHSGAIAVDMESAAVGDSARRHGVPFMALRVIADTAHDCLPNVLGRALGGGALLPRGPHFWWMLLSTPSSWSGIARLGRRFMRARGVLARCGRAGIARTPELLGVRAR